MKINQLLSGTKEFFKDIVLEDRENMFLLRSLYLSALKNDREGFDIILNQPVDVLAPFAFEETVSVGIENKEAYAEQSFEDYYSFLSFCLDKDIDCNFLMKIIAKPSEEEFEKYFKYKGLDKSINLITTCLRTGKSDILQSLLDMGVVTESGVYQCIYFYSRKHLENFIDNSVLQNNEMFHKTFFDLNTHVYPCKLGAEKGVKPTNTNVTIFHSINFKPMISIIGDSIEAMDFSKYPQKDVLVEDIMNLCINNLCASSSEAQREFKDIESFEKLKSATSTISYLHNKQTIAELLIKMCKARMMDMSDDVVIPLQSGEKASMSFEDWIKPHKSLESKLTEAKVFILDKNLSEDSPNRENQKRVKI